MQNFIQIGNWDIVPLLLQLDRRSDLWHQYWGRTTREGTAHPAAACSDIWIRYRPFDQLISDESYNEPFTDMVWYPAYDALPELRLIIQALMARVSATSVGGCLITRIKPGGQVKPHSDAVSWHARRHDCKVYIPLKTNPQCVNYCDGEALVMGVGQAWVFDNLLDHSVVNAGDEERITLICSFTTE